MGAAYNPSVVSITMGAFTGTLDFSANNNSPTMQTFSGAGTGVRTLNMGSGTWTITGNATSVLNIGTTTNLTFTGSATINLTYSGSTGTRTVAVGSIITASTPITINITAGSDIVDFTGSNPNYYNLNFTGFTGSWTNSSTTHNFYGSLTLGTGMTVSSSSVIMTFLATTSQTITTNGVQINRAFTFNGVGGSWTLQDNLNMGGASQRNLTLTNGSLDANSKNVTCAGFSSSNSNVRSLTMGTGVWTLTNNNTTIWDINTFTNLTLSAASSTINCTGTNTLIFIFRGFNYGTINFTVATAILLSGGNINVTTLTTPATATITVGSSAVWNISNFSGQQTTVISELNAAFFSPNNQSFYNVTVNKTAGQSFTLTGDLICTNLLTLTQGTLNANNFNVTAANFNSSNTNTRVLTMGSGTWTLTGTGTVWDTSTVTNMTLNANTSTIKITDSSVTSKTFAGGAMTYYNIWLTGGSGDYVIGTTTATTVFNGFKVDRPAIVKFFAGKTITINDATAWDVDGSSVTLESTVPGSAWNLNVTSGTINSSYIILYDSSAAGGATFNALDSLDGGGNTGWVFGAAGVVQNAARDQNGVPTLIAVSSVDGSTPVRLQVNAATGALIVQSS